MSPQTSGLLYFCPSITTSPSLEPTLSGLVHLFPEAPIRALLGPRTELPGESVVSHWPFPQALLPLPLPLQWFVLKDTTSGQLHLRLEWLSLITDPEAVIEVSAGCRAPWQKGGGGNLWQAWSM